MLESMCNEVQLTPVASEMMHPSVKNGTAALEAANGKISQDFILLNYLCQKG